MHFACVYLDQMFREEELFQMNAVASNVANLYRYLETYDAICIVSKKKTDPDGIPSVKSKLKSIKVVYQSNENYKRKIIDKFSNE